LGSASRAFKKAIILPKNTTISSRINIYLKFCPSHNQVVPGSNPGGPTFIAIGFALVRRPFFILKCIGKCIKFVYYFVRCSSQL